MKALVYLAPHTLVYRDAAAPEPRPGEVIVRVEAVGICGSDMHAYHGHDARRPPPLILGHEAAGVALSGRFEGARVTVNPLVTCGACDACLGGETQLCATRQILSMPPRPGGFAELVGVPERNVVAVPAGLDIAKAALAEPVAVAYHAVQRGRRALSRPLSAARCVVLGGGAIGIASALVLAMEGAGAIHIGEPNARRHPTLARAGSFSVYVPGQDGEPADASVDLVIDAVGADATRAAASRLARPGGAIVHVGLLPGVGGLDIRRITLQEITFIGTYCYTMLEFRATVAALAAGRLGALDWFEERPLADGARAFGDLDAGNTAAAKIVLRPGH